MDTMFPTVDYSKLIQRDQVIAYMKEFGSITSLEGFRDLGIARVPNRISELRQRGYVIEGCDDDAPNRWGKATSFKRYRLISEPNND